MRQIGRFGEGQSDPAVAPRCVPSGYLEAAHRVRKSRRSRWHLVNLLLRLVLLCLCVGTPLMGVQMALAAQAHLAHQDSVATHLISQRPYNGGPTRQCNGPTDTNCVNSSKPPPPSSSSSSSTGGRGSGSYETICVGSCNGFFKFLISIVYAFYEAGKILAAFIQYDFAGWAACVLSAGAVSCPTTSGGTPWSFECPVVHLSSTFSSYSYDSSTGLITTSLGAATYTLVIDGSIGNDHRTIYQLAQNAVNNDSVNDWLSGDAFVGNTSASPTSNLASEPGHLMYTYDADTISLPRVVQLSSFSLGIGFLMIGPLFALAGFQILMASVGAATYRGVATAMEAMGRVVLAAAIVGLSYYVVQMLLDFTNQLNDAVVKLHQQIGYPQTSIDGVSAVSYSNAHDTPQSFRGMVMPMSLWGCVIDDFIGLMATRVANMIGSMVPLIGGILGLAGRVKEIIDLVNDMGEFLLLIASVTLWGQAIARIVLLDYYIVLAPVALACWGLPGQMGSQVTKAWFKGFLQLLFMQTVQLLILTSLPALLPDFGLMKFPHAGDLVNPPLQSFLAQLPPIIVAFAATGAPKVMMGMGPMNTVAKAGSIAGKAIGAAGIAINQMFHN